ncbi:MAG: nitrous oxide reductase family maturation protein NosD [Ottowia sp.]|nr:nitrous oxide reductase family maturation protein NosD [Ottowia sp.]
MGAAGGRLAWLLAAAAAAHGAAAAATLSVAPGQSIQAAIDRAAPGDIVEVQRARYMENLRIEKTLTLRGIERPTVDGGGKGNTILVTAPDVTIEGIIVANSGDDRVAQNAGIYIYPGAHRAKVQHCYLSYNLFGLWIEKADDVQILHNNITGKRDYDSPRRGNGVQLYNTKGARIIGNEVSFVRDALYIDVSHHAEFRQNNMHHSRYGTHYMNSYYNVWEDNDTWKNQAGLALMEVRDQVIRNNRAWSNLDHGIMLRTVQDAVIENNIVMDNKRGFFVYDLEYAELRGNVIAGNQTGVHLAGAAKNVWDGNDLIGNRLQVRYVLTRDQDWGGEQGNYWSNYRGWDRDRDGRGDIPYEANDIVDRLSWRYPAVQMLMASPAVQALRLVGQQFPVLRVPSVVEVRPRMMPRSTEWAQWRARVQKKSPNVR